MLSRGNAGRNILFSIAACVLAAILAGCGSSGSSSTTLSSSASSEAAHGISSVSSSECTEGVASESGSPGNADTHDSRPDAPANEAGISGQQESSPGNFQGENHSSASTPSSEPENITVSVSIDSSTAGDRSIGSFGKTVTLKAGSSVYDALKACGVSVGGSGSYVTSINGLSEKDCGPTSGWTYYVNGGFASKSASSYKLKSGDSVRWYYVCSYDDRP